MAYDRELADRLRAVLGTYRAGDDGPAVTEKAMFGGLAFLVDGAMAVAAGSHGGLMVRCDPARTQELRARPHAGPMIMRDRELTGWLLVGAAGVDTEDDLRSWVDLAVAHVRTLPPSSRPTRTR